MQPGINLRSKKLSQGFLQSLVCSCKFIFPHEISSVFVWVFHSLAEMVGRKGGSELWKVKIPNVEIARERTAL